MSYHCLSPIYSTFVYALSFVSIPKIDAKALSHPWVHNAMENEMSSLLANATWDLTLLSPGKFTVGCR